MDQPDHRHWFRLIRLHTGLQCSRDWLLMWPSVNDSCGKPHKCTLKLTLYSNFVFIINLFLLQWSHFQHAAKKTFVFDKSSQETNRNLKGPLYDEQTVEWWVGSWPPFVDIFQWGRHTPGTEFSFCWNCCSCPPSTSLWILSNELEMKEVAEKSVF